MPDPSIEELSESNGLTPSQNRADKFDIFGTYTVIILQRYWDTILSLSQHTQQRGKKKQNKKRLRTILETESIQQGLKFLFMA